MSFKDMVFGLCKGRFFWILSSKILSSILSEFHTTPTSGHFGFHKTLPRLHYDFCWLNMWRTVWDYIRQCDICQRSKLESVSLAGLLQPLPILDCIWSDISIDFVGSLPLSNGQSVVMVMVDRLSKYTYFIPLSHPYTALSVAKAFVDHVVRLHGMPTSLVSDKDRIFISNFWRTLFLLQGTKLCFKFYLPSSDGW